MLLSIAERKLRERLFPIRECRNSTAKPTDKPTTLAAETAAAETAAVYAYGGLNPRLALPLSVAH